MKFKRSTPYDIRIKPSANGGFVADIGCCTMVYSEGEEEQMTSDLLEYIRSPKRTERSYNQIQKNIVPEQPRSHPDPGEDQAQCETTC